MMKSFINSFLNHHKKSVVGLDIGSMSVKAVELAVSGGRYAVNRVGKTDIALNGCNGSDSIVDAIVSCVKKIGVKTDLAVCAVDATEAAVCSFVLDPMPRQEADYAILMEAEHVSPVEMDKTVVDYQLFREYEEGRELKGMLVAAKAEAVRQKCELVQKASLQPVLMDVDTLALINCYSVFGKDRQSGTSAIVHFNSGYTNLVIVGRESLPFIRNISHCRREIFGAIADEIGIEKKLLRSFLFDKTHQECMEGGIWESFAEAASAVAREVSDTLKYYRRHGNATVDRIKLCGDFACVDGCDELFAEKLNTKVELWNPLSNAGFVSKGTNDKEFSEKEGCGMAVAMGLAMRRLLN